MQESPIILKSVHWFSLQINGMVSIWQRQRLFSTVLQMTFYISISFISFFSVVGLNFDSLCYNITGFVCYSVFNVGLFYVKTIQVN